jgi:hypothetical protein
MLANRYQHRAIWTTTSTFCLASALALAAVSGCGSSNPYPVTKVSGKITYEDGSLIPADRMRLIFVPQTPTVDPKTPPHKGTAEVIVKTGEVKFVNTFGFQDGIIKGEHRVFVQCIFEGSKPRKLVPDEYADAEKTPLRVQSSDTPFDLKVAKPH